MHFRYRPAITSVALVLIYAVALQSLAQPATTVHGSIQSPAYPGPAASPTPGGYPGPVPTATPRPTVTARPTATRILLSPTPTSTDTPSVMLTPARPTRRSPTRSAPPRATAEVTRRPTPTPGVAILLPPTVTRRAPGASPAPTEQQAPPTPTRPVTAAVAEVEKPVATSMPELAPPATELLPPVVKGQDGPGMPLTLLAGVLLAALAWWVWRKWLASGVDVTTENPEELR